MDKKQDRQAEYRQRTIRSMQELGTYREEFDPLIEIYAGLLADYDEATARFNQEGKEYETKTAAGGTKKSGTVYALERLRGDILQYAGRLQLTPQSIEQGRLDTVQKGSLIEVLERIEQGLDEYERQRERGTHRADKVE